MATGKGKAAARERGRAWGPGRRRTPGGATNPSAGRATCCAGRDPGGHPRQRPVPRPSAGAATLLAAARLLSPLRRAASPQPLPGFLFAWRGSPSPGGTEASPRPLPTAVVVKTQPQGPVQPGAAAGCDSRSSSRPRGASVCSFQARWTPKAACPPRGAQRAAVAPSCGRSWRSAHALARRLFGGSDGPLHAQPSS